MDTRIPAPPVRVQPADVLGPTSSRWHVEPAQSSARFVAATLWGRVPVAGELGPTSGELAWDGAKARGRLTISATELRSGIRMRDRHLRSGAFFDVERHPEITFDPVDAVIERGRLRLAGKILVRGKRHRLTCTAAIAPIAANRIALEANVPLDLDELGMSRGLLRMIPAPVSANVRIVLDRASA